MKDERMRELAILGLEAERSRIEEELAMLRGAVQPAQPAKKRLGRPPASAKAAVVETDGRKTRKKRKMSAAKKAALSERMKRIWAERKKGTR
jgi:hypothetical protein